MPARFSRNQAVYARHPTTGETYEGVIEDYAWEAGGYVYSVRTPIWREKKWWKTEELSAKEPPRSVAPQTLW